MPLLYRHQAVTYYGCAMETKPPDTNLSKLQTGCIMRSYEKENGEPENIVLGQISKELRFLQRHSQYVNEIVRVLKELRLTTALIKECRTGAVMPGVTRQEMLIYHQGVFLHLVHQMKDKVMQLVNLMTEEAVPEKPAGEGDIPVSDLLKKKGEILKKIGIENEIREWEQENPKSKIAVALRKRTAYQHRVSGLGYNPDFLNLGFTDIMSQPSVQEIISDYGKERIKKMQEESSERLFSGAVSKAEDTLEAINQNIEKISGALIAHFKLPISPEDVKRIMDAHLAMPESFKVVNQAAMSKVPEFHKELTDEWVKMVMRAYGKDVAAIYLVGSVGRGEYEEGYSDINLYVVLNIDVAVPDTMKENPIISLRVFTRAQFLTDECRKFRIIARADGILLAGEDLTKEEDVPKAGLFLALALNDDILENLDKATKWMVENPGATPLQISLKSRRVAKRILDFIYGVVMSNKPQYTASRKERIMRMVEAQPDNKNIVDTLLGVARYGVGESESFKNLIEGFRPKAEENLKKMRDVRDKIKTDERK